MTEGIERALVGLQHIIWMSNGSANKEQLANIGKYASVLYEKLAAAPASPSSDTDEESKRLLETSKRLLPHSMETAHAVLERFGALPKTAAPASPSPDMREALKLIKTLLDNDPDEPIADNGMTVLDGWRDCARALLNRTKG